MARVERDPIKPDHMDRPRLKSIVAEPEGFVLRAEWVNGARSRFSFAGPISRLKVFAPLEDPELFEQVHVINDGWAIAWNDEIDYSADSLWDLAEAQRDMTKEEFISWQDRHKLSNEDAAKVLGKTTRMIVNYRKGRNKIPSAVKLACYATAANKAFLYANLSARRPGRPKKATVRSVRRSPAGSSAKS